MTPDATNSAAVHAATELFGMQDERTIPCPMCAADLKARNLQSHLDKVHAGVTAAAANVVTWTGVDRRMEILGAIPVVTWLVGMGVLITVSDLHARVWSSVAVAGLIITSIPVVLAFAGKLTAVLTLDGDGLELSHAFGILRRRVPFPLCIATGSAHESFESGMMNDSSGYRGPHQDKRVGSFIRFHGASSRRAITAMSRKGTRFHSHWQATDHEHVKFRRLWDIELTTPEIVQLCYLLAARGIIEPRTRPDDT
jgi:hypothetical protein